MPDYWAINRELDAFLIWDYPDREPPHEMWYAFSWQGKVFSVALLRHNKIRTSDKKWLVPITITSICVPHGMPVPSPEVDAIVVKIKEAVEIWSRALAIKAGWGHEISQVQIKTEYSNREI